MLSAANSAPANIQINCPSLNVEKCELNRLVVAIASSEETPMALKGFVKVCLSKSMSMLKKTANPKIPCSTSIFKY